MNDRQFVVCRAPGTELGLLLPALHADSHIREYLFRLKYSAAFPCAIASIERLLELDWSCERHAGRDDQATVGIIVSEPSHLLAGASPSLGHLVRHATQHGLHALLLPPRLDLMFSQDGEERRRELEALVGLLDGLIGPGGADVDPRLYDQPNRSCHKTNPLRDRFEAELALTALRADLYMLGICRSHQLWNVAAGGSLVQDVVDDGWSHSSHDQRDFQVSMAEPFVLGDYEHAIEVVPGTRVARLLAGCADERGKILTNSAHHQAVEKPGRGFFVSAIITDAVRGTSMIEATEGPNFITVQFHPETAQEIPSHRALLNALARRSWIFRALKRLREQSTGPLTVDVLLTWMREQTIRFQLADYEWVRSDIANRLASVTPVVRRSSSVHRQ